MPGSRTGQSQSRVNLCYYRSPTNHVSPVFLLLPFLVRMRALAVPMPMSQKYFYVALVLLTHVRSTNWAIKVSANPYYGVALASRIDKNGRNLLQKSPIKETIFYKETYNLIDPTHRSHHILHVHVELVWIDQFASLLCPTCQR